jgi:hypothetical protein
VIKERFVLLVFCFDFVLLKMESSIMAVELDYEWGEMNSNGYSNCTECGLLDLYDGSVWGWISEKHSHPWQILCGTCLLGFARVRQNCCKCLLPLHPFNTLGTAMSFPLHTRCVMTGLFIGIFQKSTLFRRIGITTYTP